LGLWYIDIGLGGVVVPIAPGGLGGNFSIQIGPDGVFLTSGVGFGIGKAFSATLVPGFSPSEGISSKVTAQVSAPLPRPLPPIPVGVKGVYTIDERGVESIRLGYGLGFGTSVQFTPVNQTVCIAFCGKATQTKSKSSE
jgi:hypothetical protein